MPPEFKPELSEATVTSAEGPFFVARGSVCLTSEEQLPPDYAAGSCHVVAVAGSLGITFFSDVSGVYMLSTAALLAFGCLDADEERHLPVTSIEALKGVRIDTDASLADLSVSPDESVLAVSRASCVKLYSTLHLANAANGGQALPLAVWHSPEDETFVQLAWRPGGVPSQRQEPRDCVVVLSSRRLMYGRVGDELSPIDLNIKSQPIAAVAWSAGGRLLAFGAASQVVLWDFISHRICWTTDVSQLGKRDFDDSSAKTAVTGLHWLCHSSILVVMQNTPEAGPSATSNDDQEEEAEAAMAVLTWEDWSGPDQQGPPSAIALAEFFPIFIKAEAPRGADRLAAVSVEGLALSVVAHCKAADQHLSIIDAAEEQTAMVDITDDRLAVRIPAAANESDNFILGMGVDYTSTDAAVQHPIDPAEVDLPPSPLLIVATSDAKLRLFTLSHLTRVQPGLVSPPVLPWPAVSTTTAIEEVPSTEHSEAAASIADSSDSAESRHSAATSHTSIDDSSSVESIQAQVIPHRQTTSPSISHVVQSDSRVDSIRLPSLQAAASQKLSIEGSIAESDDGDVSDSNQGSSHSAGIEGPDVVPASSQPPTALNNPQQPSTGWGAELLQRTSSAAAAGAAALKREIERQSTAASVESLHKADVPFFSFGLPAKTSSVTAAELGASSRQEGVRPTSSQLEVNAVHKAEHLATARSGQPTQQHKSPQGSPFAATQSQAQLTKASMPPLPSAASQAQAAQMLGPAATFSAGVVQAKAVVPPVPSAASQAHAASMLGPCATPSSSVKQAQAVAPPVPPATSQTQATLMLGSATTAGGTARSAKAIVPPVPSLAATVQAQQLTAGVRAALPARPASMSGAASLSAPGPLIQSSIPLRPTSQRQPSTITSIQPQSSTWGSKAAQSGSMPPVPSFAAVSQAKQLRPAGVTSSDGGLSSAADMSSASQAAHQTPAATTSLATPDLATSFKTQPQQTGSQTSRTLSQQQSVSMRSATEGTPMPIRAPSVTVPFAQQQQSRMSGRSMQPGRAVDEGLKWQKDVAAFPHLVSRSQDTEEAPPLRPVAQLAGQASEAAAAEADFLQSLFETRQLEHNVTAAMTGNDSSEQGPPDAAMQQATEKLLKSVSKDVAALSAKLADQRAEFDQLQQTAKSILRRTAALPAFQLKAPDDGNGVVHQAVVLCGASEASPLKAVYDSSAALAGHLLRVLDDLADRLQALEWQATGRASVKKVYRRSENAATILYKAVNGQTAAACAQARQLDEFLQRLEAAGQLPPGCYDELCGGISDSMGNDGSDSEPHYLPRHLSPSLPRTPQTQASRSPLKRRDWHLMRNTASHQKHRTGPHVHSGIHGKQSAAHVWQGPAGEALRSSILFKLGSQAGNPRIVTIPGVGGKTAKLSGAVAAPSEAARIADHNTVPRPGVPSAKLPSQQMPSSCPQEQPPAASDPLTTASPISITSRSLQEQALPQRLPKRRTSHDQEGSREISQSEHVKEHIQDSPSASQQSRKGPSADEIRAANNELARKVRLPPSRLPPLPSSQQMAAAAQLTSADTADTKGGQLSSTAAESTLGLPTCSASVGGATAAQAARSTSQQPSKSLAATELVPPLPFTFPFTAAAASLSSCNTSTSALPSDGTLSAAVTTAAEFSMGFEASAPLQLEGSPPMTASSSQMLQTPAETLPSNALRPPAMPLFAGSNATRLHLATSDDTASGRGGPSFCGQPTATASPTSSTASASNPTPSISSAGFPWNGTSFAGNSSMVPAWPQNPSPVTLGQPGFGQPSAFGSTMSQLEQQPSKQQQAATAFGAPFGQQSGVGFTSPQGFPGHVAAYNNRHSFAACALPNTTSGGHGAFGNSAASGNSSFATAGKRGGGFGSLAACSGNTEISAVSPSRTIVPAGDKWAPRR